MERDFWDFAIATFGHEAGPFGDFLRLLARRVLAYPKQPRTEAELQAILHTSRVPGSSRRVEFPCRLRGRRASPSEAVRPVGAQRSASQ